MIAWINIAIMITSGFIFLYYYVKSVSPTALEKRIGEISYKKCTFCKKISGGFIAIPLINYIIYFFYPLLIPLPKTFPWAWSISFSIGIFVAISSGYLIWSGVKDAGEETMTPKKEHNMYKGIYNKIRHPQVIGEVFFWCVFAFCLNSFHLELISFIWKLVWYIMLKADEKDLIIRYGKKYKDYMSKTGYIIPKKVTIFLSIYKCHSCHSFFNVHTPKYII